jgi:glycosyltransferase involved in cell wall biosynthesis
MNHQPPNQKSNSRRILVVYPHNFMLRNSGVNSRYYQLVKYFIHRGFIIDLLGVSGFVDEWPENGKLQNHEISVENLFLYDFRKGLAESAGTARIIRYILKHFFYGRRKPIYNKLPNFAFSGMKRYFDELVGRTHYDYILVSYVYWAGLVENRTFRNTSLVLDISDFLTLNLYDAEQGRVNVGALLNEELRRVNLFQKVLCISDEELRFFSRLSTQPSYYYVPYFMPLPITDRENFTADICIVASNNPHNKKGIAWFYNEVMPLLPARLHYRIVGGITGYLPRMLANVNIVPFAKDLGEIYNTSAIAVCPLLGGTGMKIKVVEALAHSMPVVCTSFGLTGFQDRQFTGCSVADDPTAFAGFIHRLKEDRVFFDEQSALAGMYFRSNFELSCVYTTLDKVFQ